jgi:hypothetical protein
MFTNMSVKELFDMKKVLREEKEITDVNVRTEQLPVDKKGRLSWTEIEQRCATGKPVLVEYLYKLQNGTWIISNLQILAVTRKGSSIKLTCVDTFLGRFTKVIGATAFKNGAFKKMVLDLHNVKIVEHNTEIEKQAKQQERETMDYAGMKFRAEKAERELNEQKLQASILRGDCVLKDCQIENLQEEVKTKDIQISKTCEILGGVVQDLRDANYSKDIMDAINSIDKMQLPKGLREKLIQKAIVQATETILRKFE